ncbi:class I SAM-dependent methyltransferase [Frankia sp. AiPs1]|uniref:class I SAM-dependent methyltransferase n=1 Tax=Frankia sp. AiPs1 TaxID=573493 RepID=UPI002043EC58|nr:class I SAM-dependent methyltransferase [Frankia sp. AiPs1]MCM3925096.1 class I SAM-dependent methyltransferase [Frankia sp. AiPs1]
MLDHDSTDLVRRSYDAISYQYRRDDDEPRPYGPWIADLLARVPAGGTVLDVGCGCGVPVARALDAAGHRVTGVDLSAEQVRRARTLMPAATFLHADATEVDFPPATFDAVVSLYALIHLPLRKQPALLARIGTWLRPGGWLLAITGQDAWTGVEQDWFGSGQPMWWSQADAATYRSWIAASGLVVESEHFVPEGSSGHALFWARRPAAGNDAEAEAEVNPPGEPGGRPGRPATRG